MNSTQRKVNLLIGVALVVTAVVFAYFARVQQEDFIATYSANRLKQVEQAARDAEEEFHNIADALRFASRMVQTAASPAERSRELVAYLAVVKQYCMINLYDGNGRPLVSMVDPMAESTFEPWRFTELMAEGARKTALQTAGEVFTSRVMAQGEHWYQAFGLAWGPGDGKPNTGVVVLLVDHSILFANEINRTTESRSSLLLLDDYGKPAPNLSNDVVNLLAEASETGERESEARDLLSRMRQRLTGTMALGSSHRILGLGGPDLIASFSPIPARHGGQWMIARLTSAQLLRSEIAAGQLRLLLIYFIVSALLLGTRILFLDAARRADDLRAQVRQAEQLAHLNDKTNKIIDNIPSGVMSLTSDMKISALNQWLRSRVPANAMGQELGAAFPHALPSVMLRIEDLLASALREDRVQSVLGARLALFGEEGQYTLHAVPLERRFADSRLVLVIEDLTEVGALTSQLLRAEKLATVGVLSAGIAHEIGTPLGIVRGRAEYLLGKLGQEHPQASGVRVIIDQIDLVSRTLRQLLDFARVKPVAVRAIGLRGAAQAVAELLRFEASRRHAELVVQIGEELPLLAADPDQFQQVLVNLVMNACDACQSRPEDASGPGRVTLSAELPQGNESGEFSAELLKGGYVNIVIADNGCGIAKELVNQVFDPFFTTKKRGQGTGLGLTIVAQVVRDHGGQIELESEVGRGTRVLIKWPTARGAGISLDGRLSEVSIKSRRSGELVHG